MERSPYASIHSRDSYPKLTCIKIQNYLQLLVLILLRIFKFFKYNTIRILPIGLMLKNIYLTL